MSYGRVKRAWAGSRASAHRPGKPQNADGAWDMGHGTVTCNACHDQLRQSTFYEPAHDSGYDPLAGWVTAADPRPERAGDDGQDNDGCFPSGDREDADYTDDLISGVSAQDTRSTAGRGGGSPEDKSRDAFAGRLGDLPRRGAWWRAGSASCAGRGRWSCRRRPRGSGLVRCRAAPWYRRLR